MSRHAKSIAGLRQILSAILESRHTRPQVHQFVAVCNSIAITLIQSKIASGSIRIRHFGLSPSDIAFDAIADLFREDDDGNLVQIKVYFESIDWEKMEDELLLIHLRRLVFSRTNQGLFRMFQEIDPGLGKILRNTKLAIAALNTFVEFDHFGEPCIAPNFCDPLERLPMIDRDCLQQRLLELTNGSERIPVILAKLSRYLREQEEHSRMVPIVSVGLAIRAVYDRIEIEQQQQPEVELSIPRRYVLSQNFPNPFNPSTTIEYQLPNRGHVQINIYNSVGQLVRSLVNEQGEAGMHSVTWDGKDNGGSAVATGAYFYQVQVGEFVQAKRMLLLK